MHYGLRMWIYSRFWCLLMKLLIKHGLQYSRTELSDKCGDIMPKTSYALMSSGGKSFEIF